LKTFEEIQNVDIICVEKLEVRLMAVDGSLDEARTKTKSKDK
jgi:hypothetical protein